MNRYYSQFRRASIMRGRISILVVALGFGLSMIIGGCSSIAVYDQYAYSEGVSLKVDALSLMDEAVDSIGLHTTEVNQLQIKLAKAYEYEKGRPKNEISTEMWSILINPQRNLLGGFIDRWRTDKVLSPGFIGEAKNLVGKAFDQITELESGKLHDDDANKAFKGLVK